MKEKICGLLNFARKNKDSVFVREFIVIFIIVFVLLNLINCVMIFAYSKFGNDQNENHNSIIFNRLYNDEEKIIDSTDKIAYSLMLDPDVEMFATVDLKNFDSKYNYNNAQSVVKYISNYLMQENYIDNIMIYSYVNDSVVGYKEPSDKELKHFRELVKRDENKFTRMEFPENGIDLYYPLNDNAIIIIRLNTDLIANKIDSVENSEYEFYVLDNSGTVIFSDNQEMPGKNIKDIYGITVDEFNETVVKSLDKKVFLAQSDVNSWKYVYLYTQDKSVVKMIKTMFFSFLGLSLLIAAFIAYLVALRMYKPILNIVHIFENPNDDVKMNYLHENKKFGEFEFIAENIINTFSTYNDIKEELKEKVRQLNEHQMMVLQSQINPHFLFNTLEVINLKAMMMNGPDNEVSEMIANLSKLLRIGIESREQLFTVRNEVEHVKLYVEIMKLRYYDKFDIYIDVQKEILNCKICKITLQPLVENAISYGVKMIAGRGSIYLNGVKDGNYVKFEVIDNGAGMTDEKLEEIRERINSEELIRTESIGLQNVNKRIKLIFGTEYGIDIEKNEMGGITVKMLIPYVQ